MNCFKCNNQITDAHLVCNKKYCVFCFNDLHKKIMSKIPQKQNISFLEMEMLLEIFQLAEENGYDCIFQYPIESSGPVCAIEGEDYKENVCDNECETCDYYHFNTFVKYVLDFALFKKNVKIDIELDGSKYHEDQKDYDQERNTFLERDGWDVLRFGYNESINNTFGVLSKIKEKMKVI